MTCASFINDISEINEYLIILLYNSNAASNNKDHTPVHCDEVVILEYIIQGTIFISFKLEFYIIENCILMFSYKTVP